MTTSLHQRVYNAWHGREPDTEWGGCDQSANTERVVALIDEEVGERLRPLHFTAVPNSLIFTGAPPAPDVEPTGWQFSASAMPGGLAETFRSMNLNVADRAVLEALCREVLRGLEAYDDSLIHEPAGGAR